MKRFKWFVVMMAIIMALSSMTFAGAEGEKTITVTVVHKDGSEKKFTYQTDEEYLGKLLYDEGLIIADENNAGMFHTADGEKADFSVDQSYWAFYVGEEYATTGISQTPVYDGSTYKLVYETFTE